MKLHGRTAIVTGAARGMGLAIATRLAAEGASVLGCDLSPQDGHEQGGLSFTRIDITRDDARLILLEEAKARLGAVDILVNNAGIVGDTAADGFGSDENWRQVMDVNLDAVWALSRLFAPLLRASRAGRIVNIGSVNSEYPSKGAPAYTVAKHAVYGVTKALAFELGEFGVTVNAVLPGAVDTPMSRAFDNFDAWAKAAAGKSPLNRVGRPEDVAAAVAFLVSEEAGFITGHGLYVDGGLHLAI